jgi:hypothetical protein
MMPIVGARSKAYVVATSTQYKTLFIDFIFDPIKLAIL